MPGLESLIVITAGAILGLGLLAGIAAWCWKGWLELKRAELGSVRAAANPAVSGRIDVADLKERVRKLEAIAAGVDY
ncbi:hypothetical protein [Sphingosinicella microcystinivorans]|uniref:hypothetical protein n=1 Tax=Sphingosinicella microcystinivorans TaxID=335406 RepID=UPI0022F3F843|nr:hypothetical protein [Sphingosinicella microcystinivorans]WBX85069.1 hypothetical protein PE061_03835 [Sphingosinicella microcystinivorans]